MSKAKQALRSLALAQARVGRKVRRAARVLKRIINAMAYRSHVSHVERLGRKGIRRSRYQRRQWRYRHGEMSAEARSLIHCLCAR